MADLRSRLRLCAFLGLVLPACGGGGNSVTAPPTPTPTPAPVRSVVTQGNVELRAPDRGTTYFYNIPFTTVFPGTIEATVDWTVPSNTVWVLLSSGICTVEQFQTPGCPLGTACPCQFAVTSLASTPKPRVLSLPAAPLGSRSLIIWNLGPEAEAVSYQVVIVG